MGVIKKFVLYVTIVLALLYSLVTFECTESGLLGEYTVLSVLPEHLKYFPVQYSFKSFDIDTNVIELRNNVCLYKSARVDIPLHGFFVNVVGEKLQEWKNWLISLKDSREEWLNWGEFTDTVRGTTMEDCKNILQKSIQYLKDRAVIYYHYIKTVGLQLLQNYKVKYNVYKEKYLNSGNLNHLVSNITVVPATSNEGTTTTTTTTTTAEITPTESTGSYESSETFVATDSIVNSNYVEDFDVLFEIIDNKADKIMSKLNARVGRFEKTKLATLQPLFTSHLKHLNELSFNHAKTINKAIFDIDCKFYKNVTIEDENNNTKGTQDGETKELLFNSKDEECLSYITRQKMRDLFKEAVSVCEHYTNEIINDELNQYVEVINEELGLVREDYVDLFEEWADSLMNELKNTLVYQDLNEHILKTQNINAGENLKMIGFDRLGDFHLENQQEDELEEIEDEDIRWEKYMALKHKMINKRKELMEQEIKLHNLDKFVGEIKTHLKILSREGSEQFGILRAKANLQFQLREEEEREQKKKELERQEELKLQEEMNRLENQEQQQQEEEKEYDDDEEEVEIVTQTITETVLDHLTETFTKTSETVYTQTQTQLVL